MSLDLSQFTPEDLQKLKQALLHADDPRTSVARKPLTDLRMPSTARDRLYRPHFEWSADPPPEGLTIPPWPRLFWNRQGQEIRIESAEELARRDTTGWTEAPPMGKPLTPQELVEQEFKMLSEEDQKFVLDAHRRVKLARIQSAMGDLTSAEVSALTQKPQPVEEPKTDKAKKSA